jgi:MFS family permease
VFRAVTGFSLAGFYLVIESWLNDRASNETRGFVMSSYVAVNLGAIAAGQMLVTLYPVDGFRSFMLAGILTALAIVPVALTRSAQPAPITIVSFRPRQLYEAAPVSLVSCFMIGVAMGAFWSLGPVSVAEEGFSVTEVASFMSIAVVGGALAQYPAGRLSDRMDRRLVLLVLMIGAAVTSLVLWMLAPTGFVLVALGFLFGALSLPGYSLAAAHGYDKTANEDMVPTAATMLLANGIGSVSGPVAAAVLMSWRDRARSSCSWRRRWRCSPPMSSTAPPCNRRWRSRRRPTSTWQPPPRWGRSWRSKNSIRRMNMSRCRKSIRRWKRSPSPPTKSASGGRRA